MLTQYVDGYQHIGIPTDDLNNHMKEKEVTILG